MKIITKNKNQIVMEIHDSARPAANFWQGVRRQCRLDHIDKDMIMYMQMIDPLHATKLSAKHCEVFSGFHMLTVAEQVNLETINIVLHKNLTDEDIEKLAWSSVLRSLTFSLENKTGLGSFVEQINYFMRPKLIRKVFGRSHLSFKKMSDTANVTERAIRWQCELLAKRRSSLVLPSLSSILESANG